VLTGNHFLPIDLDNGGIEKMRTQMKEVNIPKGLTEQQFLSLVNDREQALLERGLSPQDHLAHVLNDVFIGNQKIGISYALFATDEAIRTFNLVVH
jgi:hypothetical protein